jgi:TPR repeat protein
MRDIGSDARLGERAMIQFQMSEAVPVCHVGSNAMAPETAEQMFEQGMLYSSGREVAADLVTAHMWFNLAAMKGSAEAVRLRREVAAEMLDAEIGQAQRAARDWLKAHPQPKPDAAPHWRVAA